MGYVDSRTRLLEITEHIGVAIAFGSSPSAHMSEYCKSVEVNDRHLQWSVRYPNTQDVHDEEGWIGRVQSGIIFARITGDTILSHIILDLSKNFLRSWRSLCRKCSLEVYLRNSFLTHLTVGAVQLFPSD
jgi:hypothetical protein